MEQAQDFALHSQRVLTTSGLQEACIIVSKGIITEVIMGPAPRLACPLYELGEQVIMPGLIDPHVHINEPGRTDWEGFATATRAAAAGGITTLIDMPLNSSPVTTTVAALKAKRAAAQRQLHVNCGFWGGVVPDNADQLQPLIDAGVRGIKAFLTHSGIDDFPNVTEADLHKALPVIAESGLPLLVHCELDRPHPAQADLATKPTSYQAYLASRPCSWENEAITMMIRLCREYKFRLHVVHLSSAEAIGMLKDARAEGLPITVETCPQYLYFNAEDIPDAQTIYKCAPPIRERANNEQLWQALQEGLIDFLATDHSPAPPEIKGLDTGDLSTAWGGIAGLQFLLPAIWTRARERGVSVGQLSEWLSGRAADFVGMSKKGKLAPGYDADLVIWEPESSFVVKGADIQHRHKISPYVGEELYGKVKQTYVGGRCVWRDGDFVELGVGEML